MAVQVGFAWLKQEHLHSLGVSLVEHGTPAELLALIRPDRLGQPPHGGQLIDDAHQLIAARCALGHDAHRFDGRVIDHRQFLYDATFGHVDENKVAH